MYIIKVLVFICFIFASHANAHTAWLCTVYDDSDKLTGPVIKVAMTGTKTLEVYEDDYTGKPAIFNIIEYSEEGLIALSSGKFNKSLSKLKVNMILFDHKTGDFRRFFYLVNSRYEEKYFAKCVKE